MPDYKRTTSEPHTQLVVRLTCHHDLHKLTVSRLPLTAAACEQDNYSKLTVCY